MNGAKRLLHDPTSFASPPSAPTTRGAFQQLPLKPRRGFLRSPAILPEYTVMDGCASALYAPRKSRVWHGCDLA
jgi:hypothetical protein